MKTASAIWPAGPKTSPSFMPVAPTSTVTFKDDIVPERKRKGSSTSISSEESSAASLVRRRPGNGKKANRVKTQEVSLRKKYSDREEDVPTVQEYPQPQPRKRQKITVRNSKSMVCLYVY